MNTKNIVLKYIEANLDLYGYISISDTASLFGVHRSVVSATMTHYRNKYPAYVRYSTTNKCWEASSVFVKKILKTSSFEYINAIDVILA